MLAPRMWFRCVTGRRMVPSVTISPSFKALAAAAAATTSPSSLSSSTTVSSTSRPRHLSSFVGNSHMSSPSYRVYGEEAALTVRVIAPEFRTLPKSGAVIMDKPGRLLLEFNPRFTGGGGGRGGGGSFGGPRFDWDRPIRLVLTPEEAAGLVATLDASERDGQPDETIVEVVRSGAGRGNYGTGNAGSSPSPKGGGFFDDDAIVMGNNNNYNNDRAPDKVFRARLLPPGTGSAIQLTVDYEWEGRGGQDPPSPNESRGPIEIKLMHGEYHVVKSIIQYSIPRLIGWATMMDQYIDQSLNRNGNSGGGGGTGYRKGEDFDGTIPF